MPAWEHCQYLRSGTGIDITYYREDAPHQEHVDIDAEREVITRLGREGWEAFAYSLNRDGTAVVWLFKRPKT